MRGGRLGGLGTTQQHHAASIVLVTFLGHVYSAYSVTLAHLDTPIPVPITKLETLSPESMLKPETSGPSEMRVFWV